jgi:putative endonuclease
MYYIYIIYSEKSDRYYIGHSDNPERRLIEHNTDPRSTYTSKHRPWVLKASIPISESKGYSVKVERYLKRLKSRKIIEEIIENQHDKEKIAQLVTCPDS